MQDAFQTIKGHTCTPYLDSLLRTNIHLLCHGMEWLSFSSCMYNSSPLYLTASLVNTYVRHVRKASLTKHMQYAYKCTEKTSTNLMVLLEDPLTTWFPLYCRYTIPCRWPHSVRTSSLVEVHHTYVHVYTCRGRRLTHLYVYMYSVYIMWQLYIEIIHHVFRWHHCI